MMAWTDDYQCFLDAVEKAEGGPEALIRAVRCSIPGVQTHDEARAILDRSVRHALWDYAISPVPDAFVHFFASRWAPVGVANDPDGLNLNFVGNVLAGYLGGHHG